MRILHRLLVIALCVGGVVHAVASAETAPVAAVNATDGIAIKGYDPVAYFTDRQAGTGSGRILATPGRG